MIVLRRSVAHRESFRDLEHREFAVNAILETAPVERQIKEQALCSNVNKPLARGQSCIVNYLLSGRGRQAAMEKGGNAAFFVNGEGAF